jgi:methylated-DNA-[protein]-cysteine S-methyltransferase
MTTTTILIESTVATLVGDVRIVSDNDVVVAADFADHADRLASYLAKHGVDGELRRGDSAAAMALRAYVDGDVGALTQVEVRAFGSRFQQDIWTALRRIPTGSTWTYAQLAEAAGHSGAARAAGAANGANPIALFVPCHRVVPATGGVGGYAGGPTRKAWLLRHEGAATTLATDSRQAVGSSM